MAITQSADHRVVVGTSQATVEWLNPWTLDIQFKGRGEKTVVTGVVEDCREALGSAGAVRFCLCDTSGVSGYDVDVRAPGFELLSLLQRHGLEEFVVVSTLSAIRMLAFSMGLVSKVKMKVFPSRAEAVEYCQAG